MNPTTGWLIIGCWLLLSIVIGVLLGKFIKAGSGDDDLWHAQWDDPDRHPPELPK
jgi:hypothetical protein